MVKTRIGDLAREAGITKAYHLQQKLGVAASMASRLFKDEVHGLDLHTVDRLCEFFGCAPGDLFVRVVTPSPKRARVGKAVKPEAPAGSSQRKAAAAKN